MTASPDRSPPVRVEIAKRCACKATSSGPRFIARGRWDDAEKCTKVRMFMARMACDACDEPWEEISAAGRVG